LQQLLFLAIAGALGTLSRYALGGLMQRITGTGFPYGTLLINILGCILIGLVMQVALTTDLIPSNVRAIITIGFIGSFTTFSTFSYETMKLLEDGALVSAMMNIASNVGLGLIGTFCGLLIGKIALGGV
jgi:CrcB protein